MGFHIRMADIGFRVPFSDGVFWVWTWRSPSSDSSNTTKLSNFDMRVNDGYGDLTRLSYEISPRPVSMFVDGRVDFEAF